MWLLPQQCVYLKRRGNDDNDEFTSIAELIVMNFVKPPWLEYTTGINLLWN
jgi:hypothetical protein